MNWLIQLIISAVVWLQLLDRHGKPVVFTPDTKIGRFYIGGISAFEYAVFSDALRALADMDITAEDSNSRYYMLRLQIVAITLCDRWGWRLYDHNSEAALMHLQNLPRDMLNELFIAAAGKTGLHWVLPDHEYKMQYGNQEPSEALAVNP